MFERKGNNQEFRDPEKVIPGAQDRGLLLDKTQNHPFSKMKGKKNIKVDINFHLKRGGKSISGNCILSVYNFSWFL